MCHKIWCDEKYLKKLKFYKIFWTKQDPRGGKLRCDLLKVSHWMSESLGAAMGRRKSSVPFRASSLLVLLLHLSISDLAAGPGWVDSHALPPSLEEHQWEGVVAIVSAG